MSSFQLQERIQNLVIDLLQTAFTSNADFTYSSDRNTTKIDITGEFPKVLPAYPVIRISAPKIPRLPRTFGNNLIKEVKDGVTVTDVVYGGGCDVVVKISVRGFTTPQKRLIVDWILTYLRHEYRYYIEDEAIDIVDVEDVGESFEPYDVELLYLENVELILFAEWEDINSSVSTLEEMDITPATILFDGSTQLF